MKRPVQCFICGADMFYKGDIRWGSEVSISILGEDRIVEELYAHRRCWNKFLAEQKEKK